MGSSSSRESVVPPTPDRVYTEQEILETFGDAFDLEQHNKTESGDLFDVENPYRAIHYWYLTDPKGKRLPLPSPQKVHQAIRKNAVLHGWVQPRTLDGAAPPVFCSIKNLADVAFDRTRLFRGMWVMRSNSEAPIYWLHEPDPTKYTEDETLPFRAAIAVASNLLDVIERDPQIANRTVTQVLQQHPDTVDRELLERYRQFCVGHLLCCTNELTEHCAFLRSLRNSRGGAALTAAEERALTLEAEERAGQYPWGQSKVPVEPLSTCTEETDTDDDGTRSSGLAAALPPQGADQSTDDFIRQLQYGEMIPLPPLNATANIGAFFPQVTNGSEHSGAAIALAQKDLSMANKIGAKEIKRRKVDHPSDQISTKKDERTMVGQGRSADASSKHLTSKEDGGETPLRRNLARTHPVATGKKNTKTDKTNLSNRMSEQTSDNNRLPYGAAAKAKRIPRTSHKPIVRRPGKMKQAKSDVVASPVTSSDLYKALISLQRYFNGTTAPEALKWEQLSTISICISDKHSAKQILQLAEKWNVTEHSEYCLLLVEAFRQRFLFEYGQNVEELSSKLFQDFIFNGWVDQCLQWISDSVDGRKPFPMNALHLLCSLLTFVGEHEPINSQENLERLKQKRNINLPGFVRKLSTPAYVHSHHSQLAEAHEQAEKRIRDAMKN